MSDFGVLGLEYTNNGREGVISLSGQRLCAIHRTATMSEACHKHIACFVLAHLLLAESLPTPERLQEFRNGMRARLRNVRTFVTQFPEFLENGLDNDDWLTM
ncbi:MAG TPA: hypothetical protein VFZ48_02970 [Candidatus Saccharimonadales bacterium]